MSNLSNKVLLITSRVDKGGLNEDSLTPIFEHDEDFKSNEDEFRSDTLSLGFKNEAERRSKEIYNEFLQEEFENEDEAGRLKLMVETLFARTGNFLGNSSYYGDYEFEIIETDFEYIIVIAVII